MFIARHARSNRAITGPDVTNDFELAPSHRYECVTCGRVVEYTPAPLGRPFEFFRHADGSEDCFAAETPSDEHRLATEAAVKEVYNAATGSSYRDVNIDVERWVGERSDFVITDIRMTEPTSVAVEVIYECSRLALRRRFQTLFENGYYVYLICHTGGRYDPEVLEEELEKVAGHPIDVGRFDPKTMDVSLGSTLFQRLIDFDDANVEALPKYLV